MFMAQRALLLCIASAGMASAAAFVVPGRHALPSRRMTINADTQAVAARRARFTVLRMADLSLFSPAKTNLFLRITRKREDGFHELASVFQALGLGDTLDISKLDSGTDDILSCNVDEVPLDGKNLIIKAFQLFREQTGQKAFFRCDIDKQTPLEGGMGGGSSNCATALWAANKLCGSPASNEQLIEWGGKLGSDVSFFLSLGTAYCTGRGELIENIPSIPTPKGSFWVVKPAQGCPTGQVYGKLGLSPGQDLAGPDPVALRDKMLAAGLSQDVCVNDLELPAQQVLPKLAAIKDALKQGGFHTVLLSGSGATTFCLSASPDANPKEALLAAGLWEESMLLEGPISFVSRSADGWYTFPASF